MKRILRNISYLLLMLTLFPALSSCNNEDDVEAIFNGKTWKLSRLTTKGSNAPFYPGIWKNEDEEKKSKNSLREEGNFTIVFNSVDVNGEVTGTADATGVTARIENAALRIDGKEHTITINGRISGSESDPLAKAFLQGLGKVSSYEGDSNSLTLYFEDDKITRVIGLTPGK